MQALNAIYEAVQDECDRSVWSRGVELARGENVQIESRAADEIVLRVVARAGRSAPQVTLHLDDEAWECSCAGADDPCEHVAASVIALRREQKSGAALPEKGERMGRIVYVLRDQGGHLVLERAVEFEGRRTPLPGRLTAVAAGHKSGPDFVTTAADLAIEKALASRPADATSTPALATLLGRLAQTDAVFLEDRPIRIESEPLGLVARVVDAPGGVRLFVEQDRRIERAFRNGVVLAMGGALHPVSENRLTGRELADLPRGRFFSDGDLALLVTEVLPALEGRIPTEVETKRLPTATRGEKPRLQINVRREGDALVVEPALVYGDPPVARIEGGRLVALGSGRVPIRSERAEDALAGRLRSELGLRIDSPARLAAGDAIAFAARLDQAAASGAYQLRGDAHRGFALKGRLAPQLRVDDDKLELDFGLDRGLEPGAEAGAGARGAAGRGGGRAGGGAAPADVLRAWSAGESVVSLAGGGFAELPAEWLALHGQRVADLLGARDASGRVARHALPDLALLCDDLELPPPPAFEALRPLVEDFVGIPSAPLAPELEAVLRPYQRQGIDWLVFMRRAGLGALLADDMGLGKTLQALAAIDGRTLVVAPTSVLHGWLREIERFRPSLSVSLYHGPGRSLDAAADVTITSYAILRQDADAFARVRWPIVVLDEAQTIKNPDSQVARAAMALEAEARIALTGTPVENRLEELWSQMHFLNRGLLGGRSDFRDRYARPIADGESDVAARLRKRIRPFLLRRLKSDVARDLPPLSEVVLDCDLTTEERAVYDAVRAASVREIVVRLRAGESVMAALDVLLRLRQAACHARLVPGQEDAPTSSSKLETLFARLEEAVADGHKALVFSQWTSLLDLVEPGLRERAIPFLRLDGSTRDRGAVVEAFQSPGGPPVLLLSLRAGGTGLNLTAADHVFLLDPWWNPAVEAQAADRAHRIGQERPVVVHRLIARQTVEEGILALHARKRALADAALEEADGSSRLSREDLIELLESA
ncbi:MAG: DEAD/DEAH box helicase [Myxococcota bacterium]